MPLKQYETLNTLSVLHIALFSPIFNKKYFLIGLKCSGNIQGFAMIYEQSCLVLKTIAGAVKVTRKTPTTEVSAVNFKC